MISLWLGIPKDSVSEVKTREIAAAREVSDQSYLSGDDNQGGYLWEGAALNVAGIDIGTRL